MKNYEKYADEIKNFNGKNVCDNFIKPYILNSSTCTGINCMACQLKQMTWLLEEYEEPKEPETDWNNVAVDTPILVKQYESSEWVRKHFAKYEDGTIYAWTGGRTSWNAEGVVTAWKYAKLAESEEGGVK